MRQQNRYIPTLDGWRGLSVIGVILYHGGFFKSDSLLAKLSYHGNIGVDVFFALSGFLICGLLLQEYARDGDIDGSRSRDGWRLLEVCRDSDHALREVGAEGSSRSQPVR